MDYGHEWTDEGLKDLEKRITKEWTQAANEVQEKLDAYIERFKEKDERKRQQVKDGEITQDEYTRWRYGQVMIQGRWEEMRDTLAEDLTLTGEKVDSMTQEFCYDAYALNHNYGTFEVEQGAMVDTSYTLYDRSTVERLVRDNPQMLPPPGEKVSEDIRRGEAKLWNQKQIQSVMTQALLQGESMPKIANRLAEAVGDRDKNASIRNARTMVTGAENAGRQDSYDRAEKMGIPVRKQWLATLDGRTRHEHRQLDGMIVDNDKPFKIGNDKIRYPGDPEAPGYLIYNCRCSLIAAIKGFESDLSDISKRNTDHFKSGTYEQWKKEKEKKVGGK